MAENNHSPCDRRHQCLVLSDMTLQLAAAFLALTSASRRVLTYAMIIWAVVGFKWDVVGFEWDVVGFHGKSWEIVMIFSWDLFHGNNYIMGFSGI